jgi:chromosome partitioning protein
LGRVIAIVNQKGGVGKTTTAVNLAAGLAIAERRTLLIDVDPQANTTRALGLADDPQRPSLYDALGRVAGFEEVRIPVERFAHLSLIPSDHELIGAEIELVEVDGREFQLRRLLEPVRGRFDYAILDSPPSLGLLTVNALAAADAIVVPVQCEYLALEGITQLMDTIHRMRASLNPSLAIAGILMTMYDERTNLARQVVDEVREVFGVQVFRTVIPRNVRLGEAPSHGETIFTYDVRSKGAEAYFSLVKELIEHEEKGAGQGAAQPDPRSPLARAGTGGVAASGWAEPRGAAADRPGPYPAESATAAGED